MGTHSTIITSLWMEKCWVVVGKYFPKFKAVTEQTDSIADRCGLVNALFLWKAMHMLFAQCLFFNVMENIWSGRNIKRRRNTPRTVAGYVPWKFCEEHQLFWCAKTTWRLKEILVFWKEIWWSLMTHWCLWRCVTLTRPCLYFFFCLESFLASTLIQMWKQRAKFCREENSRHSESQDRKVNQKLTVSIFPSQTAF